MTADLHLSFHWLQMLKKIYLKGWLFFGLVFYFLSFQNSLEKIFGGCPINASM